MRKTCTKCGETKHLHVNTTYKTKNGDIRHSLHCRKCTRERLKAYYHSLRGEKKRAYIYKCNGWNRRRSHQLLNLTK